MGRYREGRGSQCSWRVTILQRVKQSIKMAKAGGQEVAEVPYELKLNQDSKGQSYKNQSSRLNLTPAPITASIEMVINVKAESMSSLL